MSGRNWIEERGREAIWQTWSGKAERSGAGVVAEDYRCASPTAERSCSAIWGFSGRCEFRENTHPACVTLGCVLIRPGSLPPSPRRHRQLGELLPKLTPGFSRYSVRSWWKLNHRQLAMQRLLSERNVFTYLVVGSFLSSPPTLFEVVESL